MKRIVQLILLAGGLLLPAVLAGQKPEIEWIRGTDFSRIHTFTWAIAAYPIQDPDASMGLGRAIQDELGSKGVRFVDPKQNFDVFVTYNAKINLDPQNSSKKSISITVRIFDSKNNSVLWRAGSFFQLTEDKEQNRRTARELVTELFREYPPRS